MSRADSAQEIIDEAYLAWCSSERVMPNGFVGWFEYIDENGDRCWAFVSPPNQSMTVTTGMVYHLDMLLRTNIAEQLIVEMGDED